MKDIFIPLQYILTGKQLKSTDNYVFMYMIEFSEVNASKFWIWNIDVSLKYQKFKLMIGVSGVV